MLQQIVRFLHCFSYYLAHVHTYRSLQAAGWSISRYSQWLDDHPAEKDRLNFIKLVCYVIFYSAVLNSFNDNQLCILSGNKSGINPFASAVKFVCYSIFYSATIQQFFHDRTLIWLKSLMERACAVYYLRENFCDLDLMTDDPKMKSLKCLILMHQIGDVMNKPM